MSFLRSRPVSYSVPRSMATTASVGGCDVLSDMLEMAVSTISAPASMALVYVDITIPEVAWQCRCTGSPMSSLSCLTSS